MVCRGSLCSSRRMPYGTTCRCPPRKENRRSVMMTHGFMNDASAFSAVILKSAHEGNVVFNSRVDTLTMKNGKKAEIPVAGMFEPDEAGKIKVWRDYFDLATFTKQIS